MKIIVDAFGGDNAPVEILKGCEAAVRELGIQILLTGPEAQVKKAAQENNIALAGMEIFDAPQVMPVEAEPTELTKTYRDSSIAVGCRLLADGKGDAFVSAGSTGALTVGASLLVKRLRGVKRVTIATVIPCKNGCYMLTDAGANAECRPEMLVQFGVMASAYMSKVLNIKEPRVGLINIGTEESKGTPLQVEAFQRFQEAPVHFVGNVEPRDLPFGACDVAVADGFTGNVVLKLTEGLGSYFAKELSDLFKANMLSKLSAAMVMKGIKAFKGKMDYKEYGGAPLLGASLPVIKAHGSSDARAMKNAIRQAMKFCRCDVNGAIMTSLARLKETKETGDAQ